MNDNLNNVLEDGAIQEEKPLIDYSEILKKKKSALFFKRCFDILASGIGLLFLLPLFLIVAIAIKCTSKGPIFFRQKRVGKKGKPFNIYKFRTMVINAESKGLLITQTHDARITKVGMILRKCKIDELPQLMNVFSGKMSLVGPRPQTYFYYDQYDEYQKQQFLIKPGITGSASLEFSDEESIIESFAQEDRNITYMREIVPRKTKLNLDYITKMNVFYDIKLIFKTFFAVIRKR